MTMQTILLSHGDYLSGQPQTQIMVRNTQDKEEVQQYGRLFCTETVQGDFLLSTNQTGLLN